MLKKFIDNDREESGLWKDRVIESIREVRSLVFPSLVPKSLSLERQEYLYRNIQPLLLKEYWDNTL